MTESQVSLAVVVPNCNARHLLARSLASVAAQSGQPAQVLVLDQGSMDGVDDWLRLCWPSVELRSIRAGTSLDEALGAVSAPAIAFLEPGDVWPKGYLAALAQSWAEDMAGDRLATPALRLTRAPDGALRRSGSASDPTSLSAVSVRTAALRSPVAGPKQADLANELRRRCESLAVRSWPTGQQPVRVRTDVRSSAHPAADTDAWSAELERAAAVLPASTDVVLLDLQTHRRPAGWLDLLGMAAQLGRTGRSLRAFTLAEWAWPALEAASVNTPLVMTSVAPLDLAHATDLLCIEELARRSGPRPIRLCVRALAPSTPTLVSRLLETIAAQADFELWVADAVSQHYAVSLLGRQHVRLVSPPLLALAPILRELGERSLIQPTMLGPDLVTDADLATRMAAAELFWQGIDHEAGRRLGLGLARVLGAWRWLKGPVLQQAWLAMLVGWAVARSQQPPLRTTEPDAALLAALCGCPAVLDPVDSKLQDFAATWPHALQALGIGLITRSRATR